MSQTPARRPQIEPSWLPHLQSVFDSESMRALRQFLVREKQQHAVYPPMSEIFRAFELTPLPQVKVVILGQDPYHGPGQAHGLCFSVRRGVRPPPSLENIFKEIHSELGLPRPEHGDLSHWARQGVLLLNTVLTVRHRQAASHRGKGWEVFTDRVIQVVSQQRRGVVFLLWGRAARDKAALIDGRKHLILESPHPSPHSADRGFFGNGHFQRANAHLEGRGEEAIDWSLPG